MRRTLKNRLFSPLIWLLVATFFKGMMWSGVVPLWHFPDEQAHFAQLQNIAEGRPDIGTGKLTSREIHDSEATLGTLRDERGNNRFTFHPEYNIPYTNTFTGEAELKLKALDFSNRQEMVIREATSYPPLYYTIGSLFYRLVYWGNLFIRVFSIRIFSVLITVATIWLVYQIGNLVFAKASLAFTLAILVSFQPMFTFVSAGVSSDILFNFFFTLFIWGALLILQKVNTKSMIILMLSVVGGLLTKQQMVVAILLLSLILGVIVSKGLKHRKKKHLSTQMAILIGISFLLIFLALKYGEVYRIAGFIKAGKDTTLQDLDLVEHLIWTGRHTIAEVLPWYWGVFKWLGVVLPRWVNRVQMRLLALVVIGLVIWPLRILRSHKIKKIDWQIGFLALVSIFYFIVVTLWDWQFRKAYGFSFGIQGRYFFPTIVAHMGLILFGLIQLIPAKWQKWLLLLLNSWWLVLSFVGLWVVATAYFQIWPLRTFWYQISQYKPFFFKNYWWFLWLGLYLISLVGLVKGLIRNFSKYESKKE